MFKPIRTEEFPPSKERKREREAIKRFEAENKEFLNDPNGRKLMRILLMYHKTRRLILDFKKNAEPKESIEKLGKIVNYLKVFVELIGFCGIIKNMTVSNLERMYQKEKGTTGGILKHPDTIQGMLDQVSPNIVYTTYLYMIKEGCLFYDNSGGFPLTYRDLFRSFYFGNYMAPDYNEALSSLNDYIRNSSIQEYDPFLPGKLQLGGKLDLEAYNKFVAMYNAYYQLSDKFQLSDDPRTVKLKFTSSSKTKQDSLDGISQFFEKCLAESLHNIDEFHGLVKKTSNELTHQDLQHLYMLVGFKAVKVLSHRAPFQEIFENLQKKSQQKIQSSINGISKREVDLVKKFKSLSLSTEPGDISLATGIPITKVEEILINI